jgi:hypothetical protein
MGSALKVKGVRGTLTTAKIAEEADEVDEILKTFSLGQLPDRDLG